MVSYNISIVTFNLYYELMNDYYSPVNTAILIRFAIQIDLV